MGHNHAPVSTVEVELPSQNLFDERHAALAGLENPSDLLQQRSRWRRAARFLTLDGFSGRFAMYSIFREFSFHRKPRAGGKSAKSRKTSERWAESERENENSALTLPREPKDVSKVQVFGTLHGDACLAFTERRPGSLQRQRCGIFGCLRISSRFPDQVKKCDDELF